MVNFLNLARELNIQGYVHGDELRAKCPFHSDNNPSFSLNMKQGTWICFAGCGSGEFFGLVERVLGCSPGEARDWVNSNGSKTTLNSLLSSLQEELYPQVEQLGTATPKPWLDNYNLMNNDQMPIWFMDRGFTWHTVNHWNIRYSSVMDSIAIPVYWQNELVGTITRNNNPNLPKYENSSGLPRSEMLFGEINKGKSDIIICEGALDLLWLWQNGYNAIGLLGNVISLRQIQLLTEYRFGELVLALDNDQGGETGKKKILELATKNWMPQQITQMNFPDGKKDPNDCSPTLLKELYEQRSPAFQFSL